MWDKLKGKKTYISCILMVLYAISGFLLGHIEANVATSIIFEAMVLAGLRNAL